MTIKDYLGSNCIVHPRAAAPELPPIGYTLSDVYTSWSDAKQAAYNYTFRLMQGVNGRNFRITSRNTFGFCVAFEFDCEGRDVLVRITPNSTHVYYL